MIEDGKLDEVGNQYLQYCIVQIIGVLVEGRSECSDGFRIHFGRFKVNEALIYLISSIWPAIASLNCRVY